MQTLDMSSLAMKVLHTTATTCHSMARKGTINRAYDAMPGMVVFIAVCLTIALILAVLLVYVSVTDHYAAKRMARVIPRHARVRASQVQTQNLKGNR